MTSARKRQANRANSRASTGPKTPLGRARAARNALKHGLRMPVLRDPACAAEVNDLVRLLTAEKVGPQTRVLLQQFAEAQVDLVRIKEARHDLVAEAFDPECESPKQREWRLTMPMKLATRALKGQLQKDEIKHLLRPPPEGPSKYAEVMRVCAKRLTAIERYEQRAYSRRKSAIRELDAAGFVWPRAQCEASNVLGANAVDTTSSTPTEPKEVDPLGADT
jgi:hypothetical protein